MPLASATSGTMQPSQTEQSPPTAPPAPKTPHDHHRTFIPIIVIILVMLAAIAIAIVTLGRSKSTTETTLTPGDSESPRPVLTFAGKNAKYSINIPKVWTRLIVSEYEKVLVDLENPGLANSQKQSLTDYFSASETVFWDDKSTSVFRPKFLVIVTPGSTISAEVARLKGISQSIYTQVQYPEDKELTFQSLPAHSLVAKGTIGNNQIHERRLVFERNGTVYTVSIMTLEADWQYNFDNLFGETANSFSI